MYLLFNGSRLNIPIKNEDVRFMMAVWSDSPLMLNSMGKVNRINPTQTW